MRAWWPCMTSWPRARCRDPSEVAGARAAIAGVLAASVVVLSMKADGDNVDALRGLGALLAVLALLVGADVVAWWRHRRDK
jgi:hypothetical protein